MLKVLLAAAMVAAPFPVAPATPLIDGDAIPKVVCPVYAGPVLQGFSMGTAFRVGGHLLLSVKHVTNVGNCLIDGKPITVTYQGPDQDFSMISASAGPRIAIDCGGFVKGHRYVAVGHARGRDELAFISLDGTGIKVGQYSLLTGVYTVIPGMSGGPVIDMDTGKVVGLVNAYDMQHGISMSVALKDTPACRS